MNIDDRLHSLTTIVDVQLEEGAASRGTGFFFQVLAPSNDESGSGWREVVSNWLITNRHVLLPDGRIPAELTFRLRKISDDDRIEWHEVSMASPTLGAKALLHKNSAVDVVAIDVTDELHAALKEEIPITYSAMGEDDLPGNNKINVNVTSDVVIVGYPKSFYDEVNKFPVVKSGMIASRWGANFRGDVAFLIDAKLFPGSSGSVVLSKPNDFIVENGHLFGSQDKQCAFLGVYSGEPYKISETPEETDEGIVYRKDYFDVGLVWYSSVVPEIISNGKTLADLAAEIAARPAVATPRD